MMTAYEIPLIAAAQQFPISLGGIPYQLRVWWNDADQGGWTLDILDSTGNPVLLGVPMTTSMDLLAQYKHLNIGGGAALYVQTDHAQGIPPTYDDLGTTSHLFFVTDL